MMPLEKQVCNQTLSARLKELGVPQNGYFTWCIHEDNSEVIVGQELIETYGLQEICSAFTTSELGEMLPMGTKFEKYSLNGMPRFCVIEVESISNMGIHDENEAQSRAKMLIYLIENNLVKPSELSARIGG